MGTITHAKVATIPADPAADITTDDWNDGHTISLDKTDVGLGNVDNTSDASKPVSTATQTALDLKANTSALGDYLTEADAATTYQPLDADLTAIAGLDATAGYLAKTAANTYARRTLTGTANRVTITNGDGTTGNPVFNISATYDALWQPVDADLTALAGLDATGGLLAKTAANTYARRTITGTANKVTVTNGDGVSGNPTLTLPDALTLVTPALGTPASGNLSSCTADGTDAVGFRNIPQNAQTGNYTLVLADAGKHIYHAVGAGAGDTYTIPANGSVAYPIGTAITFINDDATNAVTIAITTDTLVLSPGTTTGSRTLATGGVATAIKVTSTRWIISGSGLT
jgi:hypothetical protein